MKRRKINQERFAEACTRMKLSVMNVGTCSEHQSTTREFPTSYKKYLSTFLKLPRIYLDLDA